MLVDKSDYYERWREEGYDVGTIVGQTEFWVSIYRYAISVKKRANQRKCEAESDVQDRKRVLAEIESYIEHISFKEDMDRFNKKYPGRRDNQLARKICAESEYRYLINRWIKIKQAKEEKQTDE